MKRRDLKRCEVELERWMSEVFEGLGRRERRDALGSYLLGLLLDGERKSIEPIAQRLVDDVGETQAMRRDPSATPG